MSFRGGFDSVVVRFGYFRIFFLWVNVGLEVVRRFFLVFFGFGFGVVW